MPASSFLITNFLSGLAKAAGIDGTAALTQLVAHRVTEAEEKLEKRRCPNDPIENFRDEVLHSITQLRNRTALCISNAELQQRIWCLLMEQTLASYEATTRRDLDFVNANLEQIEAALTSYSNLLHSRQKLRGVAVVISILSLGLIIVAMYLAQHFHLVGEAPTPILGIPAGVLLWSAIGSFAAILYRFSNAGDSDLEDPLQWFFSRPLTGIIMGALTYLIIKAGMLTLTGGTQTTQTSLVGNTEVMCLVAFLAGFSDRFSDTLLRSMVGRFGGEKMDALVSVKPPSMVSSSKLLSALTAIPTRIHATRSDESENTVLTASVTNVAVGASVPMSSQN